jgi:hypothetical protein
MQSKWSGRGKVGKIRSVSAVGLGRDCNVDAWLSRSRMSPTGHLDAVDPFCRRPSPLSDCRLSIPLPTHVISLFCWNRSR